MDTGARTLNAFGTRGRLSAHPVTGEHKWRNVQRGMRLLRRHEGAGSILRRSIDGRLVRRARWTAS